MIVTAPRKPEKAPRRRALIVSIALHALLGLGLVQVLLMPGSLRNWLRLGQVHEPPVEHLRYVAMPEAAHPALAPARPAARQPVVPSGAPAAPAPTPIVAPSVVPKTVPVAPSNTTPTVPDMTGVGPVAGTGGPGEGAHIEYHGPRVWSTPAGPSGESRLSQAERTDSSMHAMIQHHNDSLAMLGPHRQPGDWTVEHNGQKYGIDQKFIHLGPVEIPTAILAALPLNNFTGNPIAAANERLLTQRHDDIAFQATRGMNEEEFRKAVKEERLRKEREHVEEQKQKDQHPPPDQQNPPPVAKSNAPQQ